MTKADIASEVLRKHPENNIQARIFSTNQVLICMDEWVQEVSKIGGSASVSDLSDDANLMRELALVSSLVDQIGRDNCPATRGAVKIRLGTMVQRLMKDNR